MSETNRKITRSFVPKEHNPDNKIIIYGAGVYGEIAIYALAFWGLNADYICDQSLEEGSEYMGVSAIRLSNASKLADAEVILASYNYVGEMLGKCREYGIENVFDMYEMLKLSLDTQYELSGRAKGRMKDVSGYLQMLSSLSSDELNVNHLEFIVTEKCSFKCKGCANLMPEYENPCEVSVAAIIRAFDNCCEYFDHIGEIYLLGGEPFLNEKLDEVVSYIGNHGYEGKISIFTNGTIIPTSEVLKVLAQMKVLVHISDYGNPRQKSEELSKVLEDYQISHVVKPYDTWIDLTVDEKRDEAAVQSGYDNCFFRKNYTIHRGKLFICPRAANAFAQGKINEGKRLFIDIENGENIKDRIRSFLEDSKYTDMCAICAGGNLKGKTIPAGEQLDESNRVD